MANVSPLYVVFFKRISRSEALYQSHAAIISTTKLVYNVRIDSLQGPYN